jgi:hypothetical protein
MFVVAKKDGGARIIQDFLAINQQTTVDKYTLRDEMCRSASLTLVKQD